MILRTVAAAALGAVLALACAGFAATAFADSGDCSQPVSSGSSATATDCLFILQAAVGAQTCSPQCICAPTGNLPISATNALYCLTAVVTPGTPLDCPCESPSTTTTLGGGTTTTTFGGSTTTSTTAGATTTTTLEECPTQLTLAAETIPVPCGCLTEGEPQCDGTCPAYQACYPDFELGGCYCAQLYCGDYEGSPQCYGVCENETEVCINDDDGCVCVPTDDPRCGPNQQAAATGNPPIASVCTAACGDASAPQCDGGCPAGQFCHDIFGEGCGCEDVGCGTFGPQPVCAGVCPPDYVCFDYGDSCGCTPTIFD